MRSYLCAKGYDKQKNRLLSVCDNCQYFLCCINEIKNNGQPFRRYKVRNCKVNIFNDKKIEIVIYKKSFYWLEDSANLITDVKKNFYNYDCPKRGKVLIPKKNNVRMMHLYDSLNACSKRAKDNYFGYAYANEWKYFFTFTFDKEKVNRYDDEEVIHHWTLFRKRLQYFDKDVKILCIKERHKDGALHFHGLIYTEKDFILKPYYGKDGNWKLSKTGAPLFQFDFWDFGLHTIAVLPKKDNYEVVINYLVKYTTKEANIGYRQKRFFRTQNLNYKESFVTSDGDIYDLLTVKDFKVYKDNEHVKVLRTFNINQG